MIEANAENYQIPPQEVLSQQAEPADIVAAAPEQAEDAKPLFEAIADQVTSIIDDARDGFSDPESIYFVVEAGPDENSQTIRVDGQEFYNALAKKYTAEQLNLFFIMDGDRPAFPDGINVEIELLTNGEQGSEQKILSVKFIIDHKPQTILRQQDGSGGISGAVVDEGNAASRKAIIEAVPGANNRLWVENLTDSEGNDSKKGIGWAISGGVTLDGTHIVNIAEYTTDSLGVSAPIQITAENESSFPPEAIEAAQIIYDIRGELMGWLDNSGQ